MSYFAKPNYIEYDEWFDTNIDPIDLIDYSKDTELTRSVHSKFRKFLTKNILLGSSNNFF